VNDNYFTKDHGSGGSSKSSFLAGLAKMTKGLSLEGSQPVHSKQGDAQVDVIDEEKGDLLGGGTDGKDDSNNQYFKVILFMKQVTTM
jgi:hypothetical protein